MRRASFKIRLVCIPCFIFFPFCTRCMKRISMPLTRIWPMPFSLSLLDTLNLSQSILMVTYVSNFHVSSCATYNLLFFFMLVNFDVLLYLSPFFYSCTILFSFGISWINLLFILVILAWSRLAPCQKLWFGIQKSLDFSHKWCNLRIAGRILSTPTK